MYITSIRSTSFESISSSLSSSSSSSSRSFLSMDVDGRVIRFDTISKFIAPGMRLGWIVGPPSFIAKYILLQSTSSQFPCSIAQSMFLGLMKHWGEDKLHIHLQKLQYHYIQKCQLLLNALKLYVSPKHCSYIVPTAGMFIWLKFPKLLGRMTSNELFQELVQFNVIAVPSSFFYVQSIDDVLLARHHYHHRHSSKRQLRSSHTINHFSLLLLLLLLLLLS